MAKNRVDHRIWWTRWYSRLMMLAAAVVILDWLIRMVARLMIK